MSRRLHMLVLSVLAVIVSSWLVVTAEVAVAQRRDDVSVATQAAIDRAISTNTNAITAINGRLDRIQDVANDARDEVRSMRNAMIGLAGTILVSLLMQLAQVRKQKGGTA